MLVPPGYPHPCPGTCFHGSTHTAAHAFTSECLLQKYGNKRLVEMGQSTRMMLTHQLPASREATIMYREKSGVTLLPRHIYTCPKQITALEGQGFIKITQLYF